MKTRTLIFGLAALATLAGQAQNAMEAEMLTQQQLRGTARFTAMGGAFTSLGADLSSMTQNPAGLGLYRSNDLAMTLNLGIEKFGATTNLGSFSQTQTKMRFDNIGYAGVVKLNGPMRYFQWGVSYNRRNSFDRIIQGQATLPGSSLSNYIASYTNGVHVDAISLPGEGSDSKYDPYLDSDNDWLSILGYQSFIINQKPGTTDQYAGLYQNGSRGDAVFNLKESGYSDEYNIDFAGNVNDVVYWGLGVGIVDISYTRNLIYDESIEGAYVYDDYLNAMTTGNAGFTLDAYKRLQASGANVKLGVILQPTDGLRIGAAVHTPTWLGVNHYGDGKMDFAMTPNGVTTTTGEAALSGKKWTPSFDFDTRLTGPWRWMVGASYVLGGRAIVSLDYERTEYPDMSVMSPNYNLLGGSYVENEAVNGDIKNYFRGSNVVRAGVEYSLSRSFKVRAGFNHTGSNATADALDGKMQIITSGVDPAYTFDESRNAYSAGLGYRSGAWYIDMTYQHVRANGQFSAYTPFEGYASPGADLKNSYNNLILTTGFKF